MPVAPVTNTRYGTSCSSGLLSAPGTSGGAAWGELEGGTEVQQHLGLDCVSSQIYRHCHHH